MTLDFNKFAMKGNEFINRLEEIIDCVRAVMDTMRLYVSAGEMEQALGTLPRKLQEVLEAPER